MGVSCGMASSERNTCRSQILLNYGRLQGFGRKRKAVFRNSFRTIIGKQRSIIFPTGNKIGKHNFIILTFISFTIKDNSFFRWRTTLIFICRYLQCRCGLCCAIACIYYKFLGSHSFRLTSFFSFRGFIGHNYFIRSVRLKTGYSVQAVLIGSDFNITKFHAPRSCYYICVFIRNNPK